MKQPSNSFPVLITSPRAHWTVTTIRAYSTRPTTESMVQAVDYNTVQNLSRGADWMARSQTGAGDVVSLGASENPIVWGRNGLDTSLTMSDCLPRTTSWGSIPVPPPTTCPGKMLSKTGHE